MIRIVIENLFFFLLPTLLYVTWVAFKENDWRDVKRVLRRAPLLKLFVAGAVIMLATLVLFSSRSGNDPHDVYLPPELKDGKLQPGQRMPRPSP
jgi:hypothetical protein